MMYRLLEPEFQHVDQRGSLVQLISNGCAQVNLLESHAGVTRGGHYHKLCKETFYIISGSVSVSFTKGTDREERTFHSGDIFEVLPGTLHTLYFPEECVMIAIYDRAVDSPEGRDIYRDGSVCT